MPPTDEDFFAAIIRRVLEQAGADLSIRTKIEAPLRQEYGGHRYYVAKEPARQKTDRLARAISTGTSLRDAFAGVGVSPSYGYRLIGRKVKLIR